MRRQLLKNITLFGGVETIPLQRPIMSEGHTTPTAPALVGSSEDQTQDSPTGLEATGKDPKPSRSNTMGLDDDGKLVTKTGNQAGKEPLLPKEPNETDSDGDLESESEEKPGKQEKSPVEENDEEEGEKEEEEDEDIDDGDNRGGEDEGGEYSDDGLSLISQLRSLQLLTKN